MAPLKQNNTSLQVGNPGDDNDHACFECITAFMLEVLGIIASNEKTTIADILSEIESKRQSQISIGVAVHLFVLAYFRERMKAELSGFNSVYSHVLH